MKKKKLPIYELKINLEDDAIVSAIALVEQPAIESNFIAFNQNIGYTEFTANDDKMELLGPAMIPDQYIYRIDPQTKEEFNVYFSKDTVREIAQQYLKFGFQKSMNLNHTSIPSNSYLFQSYIVDEARGMKAPKGINVPDGSWIIGVKVEDSKTWNDIKAGKVQGFSIEGIFEYLTIKLTNDDSEILEVINSINDLINKHKK